jgi:hypothetical protein
MKDLFAENLKLYQHIYPTTLVYKTDSHIT